MTQSSATRIKIVSFCCYLIFATLGPSIWLNAANAEEIWPKWSKGQVKPSVDPLGRATFKKGEIFDLPWHGHFVTRRSDLEVFIHCPTRRHFLSPCESEEFLDLIRSGKVKIIQKGIKLLALEDIPGKSGRVYHEDFGYGYVDFAAGL
ncbi:hypothetical protein LRS73_04500 [Methylobacterium currus]|uniref:hypothetical protein n=1 Tax=Methylobacterium currus TaxID=2051553 RepID=UPI001E3FD0EB|nr:hypothetical protein [Methylobacterium currus]UHC17170.1 hypothetical protein LRS73_04500 [Methylobacterium currus]